MPAYSFKQRFVAPIRKGDKNQTIRKKSKKKCKVGDRLYLYCAMRTKHCFKIGEANCIRISDIQIVADGVMVDGVALREDELNAFAMTDGFEDWEFMKRFWNQTHDLPFSGDLIEWADFEAAEVKPIAAW